jgi:hypothetical protein
MGGESAPLPPPMTAPIGALHRDYDRISIPTVWVAFALSIALHAVGLLGWIPRPPIPFEEPRLGKPSGTLAIRLVPLSSPQVETPASPPRRVMPDPVAPKRPVQPRVAPAPKEIALAPRAPVLSVERPSPAPVVVPPPVEKPRPPPAEDLAAYIASRRRAREGAAPSTPAPAPAGPAETEQQRHNRVVAENLGLTSVPSFGNNPDLGGGVFQLRSMGYDIAEFAFFGWNKDIKRNSLQVIEVRRGNNPNMEVAVVRKIISVIREHSGDDFLWQSKRLNKGMWLSARSADTAGLEDFMMREFFTEMPAVRAR